MTHGSDDSYQEIDHGTRLDFTAVCLRRFVNIIVKQRLIVIPLEEQALSTDMAVRIARLTNTTPEIWLRMQEARDLWGLEQYPKRYRHIEPVAA